MYFFVFFFFIQSFHDVLVGAPEVEEMLVQWDKEDSISSSTKGGRLVIVQKSYDGNRKEMRAFRLETLLGAGNEGTVWSGYEEEEIIEQKNCTDKIRKVLGIAATTICPDKDDDSDVVADRNHQRAQITSAGSSTRNRQQVGEQSQLGSRGNANHTAPPKKLAIKVIARHKRDTPTGPRNSNEQQAWAFTTYGDHDYNVWRDMTLKNVKAIDRMTDLLKTKQDAPTSLLRAEGCFFDNRFLVHFMEVSNRDTLIEMANKLGNGNVGLRGEELFLAAEKLLSAVAWLHKNKIAHRDIKPDNVLWTEMEEDLITSSSGGNHGILMYDPNEENARSKSDYAVYNDPQRAGGRFKIKQKDGMDDEDGHGQQKDDHGNDCMAQSSCNSSGYGSTRTGATTSPASAASSSSTTSPVAAELMPAKNTKKELTYSRSASDPTPKRMRKAPKKKHVLKLADFGTLRVVEETKRVSFTNRGTTTYKAPELVWASAERERSENALWEINELFNYDILAADMWSVGATLFGVYGLGNFIDFDEDFLYKVVNKALTQKEMDYFLDETFENFQSWTDYRSYDRHKTMAVENLIRELLQVDPQKRLTAERALQKLHESVLF